VSARFDIKALAQALEAAGYDVVLGDGLSAHKERSGRAWEVFADYGGSVRFVATVMAKPPVSERRGPYGVLREVHEITTVVCQLEPSSDFSRIIAEIEAMGGS
jgi:hypothetical protein